MEGQNHWVVLKENKKHSVGKGEKETNTQTKPSCHEASELITRITSRSIKGQCKFTWSGAPKFWARQAKFRDLVVSEQRPGHHEQPFYIELFLNDHGLFMICYWWCYAMMNIALNRCALKWTCQLGHLNNSLRSAQKHLRSPHFWPHPSHPPSPLHHSYTFSSLLAFLCSV